MVTVRSCMACEQRRLRFGRRAIDLVGQQEGGEDRALDQREFVALQVEDVGAGDVGGHQVGRELDALELAAEDARRACASAASWPGRARLR